MGVGKKEKPPRSYEEVRLDGLRVELERVNTLLSRADLIHLPIETVERELQRKTAIEWIFAERERRASAFEAAGLLRREDVERKRLEHERRMETDPIYRQEVARRERSDDLRRKVGQPPVNHGPLPPSRS